MTANASDAGGAAAVTSGEDPDDLERLIAFVNTPVQRFAIAAATSERRDVLRRIEAVVADRARAHGTSVATVALRAGESIVEQLRAAAHPEGREAPQVLFVTGLDAILTDRLGADLHPREVEEWNLARDRLPELIAARVVLWLLTGGLRSLTRSARDLADLIATRVHFAAEVETPWPGSIAPSFTESLFPPRDVDDAEQLEAVLAARDPRSTAWADAAVLRAQAHVTRGELEQARSLLTRAIEVYGEHGRKRERGRAELDLASVAIVEGDWVAAHDHLAAAQSTLDRAAVQYDRISALNARALALTVLGKFDEGLQIWRQDVVPSLQRAGDEIGVAKACEHVAQSLTLRGEYDEALRVLRRDVLPVFERHGEVRARARAQGMIADLVALRGDLDEALRIQREEELPVYERLGDVRSRAVTLGKVADILTRRGDLDEALRIRREEELPVYERLGDVRSRTVTLGKVADILTRRGDLDEALRIRREEELPVHERLGDVRSRAVTLGKVADILAARGDLDESLRILREEVLPEYERLGDLRSRAVTLGKVADILAARGDLDEALRIRREEELPVHERLGDVRSGAVTLGKVANILAARGDLNESLRILREVLPAAERLGGLDLLLGILNLGVQLIRRGRPKDLTEARGYLEHAAAMADEMRIPFPEELRVWLASDAGRGG